MKKKGGEITAGDGLQIESRAGSMIIFYLNATIQRRTEKTARKFVHMVQITQ